MKKKIIVALILLISLSTISFKEKFLFKKFSLKNIIIENNILLKDKVIKILLTEIYDNNLIFLKNKKIEVALMSNSLIESFEVKKKYPDTIIIKIFEKKPIAILQDKKNKFYISEKIDLIKFDSIKINNDLPYVIGSQKNFKLFYRDLKKINFPMSHVKKFIYYESDRWDLQTINKKTVKLPSKNYLESIKNYLNLKNDKNFENYKVFDYRIKNQLILK